MAAAAEGDEENMIALNKLDAFASQARGYKVAMGKISRSLDDLRLFSSSPSAAAAILELIMSLTREIAPAECSIYD
jgi:aspartate ammonia-lyase